jgi:hypothetical protein
MPSYLPMSVIRTMPYEELERWWEVDFSVLTSTAVAEATGLVHPTVTEALCSDDWLEQWADALYAASGELKSSVERMDYTRDRRLESTVKHSGLVSQRLGHVHRLMRERDGKQGWDMLPAHMKDARLACLALLSRHYKEERDELAAAEIARRGLPAKMPFADARYADRFESIEDAVRRGMIHAPVTPGVQAFLDMPTPALTHHAARDVTQQEERCSELRHPLLLGRWYGALEHLRDRHCELAGVTPAFSVSLPRLDVSSLQDMRTEEARQIINRRRFVRGLAQRHRECMMHARQLARAVSARREEIERPWHEARGDSREELARRHPEQLQALMSAFEPFCVPGTTEIRRDELRKRGPVTGVLIPTLKQALVDGTWRRLLPDEEA